MYLFKLYVYSSNVFTYKMLAEFVTIVSNLNINLVYSFIQYSLPEIKGLI